MEITFLGAAREVTGSCYLIRAGDAKILLDCGQIQGRRRDEARNLEVLSIPVSELDAVILSHAHIDHSGRIPLLVKQGYDGPIYTHHASQALCEIMLLDSGYLHEKDAEWENKRRSKLGRPLVTPLYTRDDAVRALPLFAGIAYGEEVEILPGVRMRLADAGHILGSAIVELWHDDGASTSKLVFSGDLGYKHAPVMRDPAKISTADLLLLESTYGDRLHRSFDETLRELGGIFEKARSAGGNILIPAFAVGRTQDLLYLLAQHYEEWGLSQWQVFLDSPMAIRATEVYSKFAALYDAPLFTRDGDVRSLPNLTCTLTTDESMAINQVKSGAIIIAGSGMCTGGRIHHHLTNNIERPETHLIFIGFQAYGTLGRRLVDGVDSVKLWGRDHVVRARIHTVGGLSAHADQEGLTDWYGQFDAAPQVCLVHGEERAQQGLSAALKKKYAVTPTIPDRGDTRKI